VAKKGAICPIFEGDMPPKKIYPEKWPQYYGHNMKAVNRIPVMVPITAPILGAHFFQGHISLKN
jgi:hypothetical protein